MQSDLPADPIIHSSRNDMFSWLADRQKGEEGATYAGDKHDKGKQTTSEEEEQLEIDDSAESAIEDLVDHSDDSSSEEDVAKPTITVPSTFEGIIGSQRVAMPRKECQSPARLSRSIEVAGRTFNSASTSHSIVKGSDNHTVSRAQASDVYIYDITTLAPLASLQSRILEEFSRVSPLTYMRLSKTHFKEIIPTVYHTFNVTIDFRKCLYGAHPMTETKRLGFWHVKHLFLGINTGLCFYPFPTPFWEAKDFMLAIINLGKPNGHRYIFPNLKGVHVAQPLLESKNEGEMSLHHLFWQALTEYITPPSCPINLHLVRDYNTHKVSHDIPDIILHYLANRNLAFHMYTMNGRAKRWKYYWTTFPHQIITFKVAGPRSPFLDQEVLSELMPILLGPDIPQDWRKKHPHSALQIPVKKATMVLNNLVVEAYRRLGQIAQAQRKRKKPLAVPIDRERYVIKVLFHKTQLKGVEMRDQIAKEEVTIYGEHRNLLWNMTAHRKRQEQTMEQDQRMKMKKAKTR